MSLESIDHVQLAMPVGAEDRARAFYSGLLGLRETPKPPNLAVRGGVWFEDGSLKVHLGVERDFRPARKAHPAFRVRGLSALERRLRDGGAVVVGADPIEGGRRLYVEDPFGNRIELIETAST